MLHYLASLVSGILVDCRRKDADMSPSGQQGAMVV
jgi:hypothetical protein